MALNTGSNPFKPKNNTGSNPFKAKNDPARLAPQRERQRANSGGGGGGGGGGMGGKPKNKGLGQGGGAGAATTTEPTSAFAVQDPEAFLRGLVTQAGFDPYRNNAYGDFTNNWVQQQAAAWNTHQATNPTNSIYDWAAQQGFGQVAATGTPAGPAMSFDDFLTQQNIGQHQFQQMNPHRRQDLRARHAGMSGTPAVAPVMTAAPGLQGLVRQKFDTMSPQQQGTYDAGKQPGSIRWNLFV